MLSVKRIVKKMQTSIMDYVIFVLDVFCRYYVKISPRVSQKRLRFGDDVGKREFIKLAKKYHQQLEEEECASVGRITVRAMSPPRLADIGVLLQQAEDATRD